MFIRFVQALSILCLMALGLAACGGSDDTSGLAVPVVPTTNPETLTGSVITWTLRDACEDGAVTLARFHELESETSNTRTGFTWPGGGNVYELTTEQTTLNLNCTAPGRRICYGAGVEATGLFWGVALDGTQPCDDCCAVCGTEPLRVDPIGLICSSQG